MLACLTAVLRQLLLAVNAAAAALRTWCSHVAHSNEPNRALQTCSG
jgi:hypothetical protein